MQAITVITYRLLIGKYYDNGKGPTKYHINVLLRTKYLN